MDGKVERFRLIGLDIRAMEHPGQPAPILRQINRSVHQGKNKGETRETWIKGRGSGR